MITQKLQEFEEEVKPIGGVLTQATLELYQAISARFLPTPAKIHYLFNLRDISKVRYIVWERLSSGNAAACISYCELGPVMVPVFSATLF